MTSVSRLRSDVPGLTEDETQQWLYMGSIVVVPTDAHCSSSLRFDLQGLVYRVKIAQVQLAMSAPHVDECLRACAHSSGHTTHYVKAEKLY